MKYPEEALEEKTEGNVLVRIQINMNGRVKVIKVLKGLSQECDKEAVRLMRLTSRKWTPASENGKSVTSTKTIVVQFNIRDFNQKTSMREGVRID
jgi:TonB family protein